MCYIKILLKKYQVYHIPCFRGNLFWPCYMRINLWLVTSETINLTLNLFYFYLYIFTFIWLSRCPGLNSEFVLFDFFILFVQKTKLKFHTKDKYILFYTCFIQLQNVSYQVRVRLRDPLRLAWWRDWPFLQGVIRETAKWLVSWRESGAWYDAVINLFFLVWIVNFVMHERWKS